MNLINHIGLIFLFSLFFACNSERKNETVIFYIENQEDFDTYSGTEFPEGSQVLFAVGREFQGQFIIKGSGSMEKPNLLAAYNPETKAVHRDWINQKPVIHGKGNVEAALCLINGEHWEITNIEVTNTDGSAGDQGLLKGIYVVAENAGVRNHITIKNCYVHHVNGRVGGKWRGGIHVHVLGDSIMTKFHNLLIEGNVIRDVGGVGIGNQSSWGPIATETYYPWTEFVIRGNFIERTGRNSIILRYAIDPLIEYNIAAASSRFDTGHSIVNFNTTNCVVQYNEAYGNTGDPDENERGGFDADYKSTGTIIQYNYSHDNHWFCGIMRRGINSDVTIRYNISQNELLGCYLYGFPTEFGLKDVKVYNNIHFFARGKGTRIFVEGGKVRIPVETEFKNNIFYFEDAAEWGFDPDETCVLENNLFFNVPAKGARALISDPLFINPGTGGTNIDMRDPERLSGYRLKADSPCVGAGTDIQGNGESDFWGGSLYKESADIGAFEQ